MIPGFLGVFFPNSRLCIFYIILKVKNTDKMHIFTLRHFMLENVKLENIQLQNDRGDYML